jgi:hypothetical protein
MMKSEIENIQNEIWMLKKKLANKSVKSSLYESSSKVGDFKVEHRTIRNPLSRLS